MFRNYPLLLYNILNPCFFSTLLKGGRGQKHEIAQIANFPIIFVTDCRFQLFRTSNFALLTFRISQHCQYINHTIFILLRPLEFLLQHLTGRNYSNFCGISHSINKCLRVIGIGQLFQVASKMLIFGSHYSEQICSGRNPVFCEKAGLKNFANSRENRENI